MARRRPGGWLQTLLLIGFVICFALSALALLALWRLTGSSATSQQTDRLATVSSEIIPSLALMEVAGDPVDALAYQALQAVQLETSRALTIFGLGRMPSARIGLTMQLAERFQRNEQPDRARQLYEQTRALAILDATLDPLARGEALLQTTVGLVALGESAQALDHAQQVKRIALQTPDLLPVQRSELVRDLLDVVTPLGDEALLQALQELARSPYLSPPGRLITPVLPAATGPTPSELAALPVAAPSAELATTTFRRQQLARQLAEFLIQGSREQATPLIQPLQEALRAEDQLRTVYFTQLSTSPDLTLSLQFWLLTQQQEWLTQKLAIAKGALGLPLMAEWETNVPAITQELATTVANLHQIMLEFAQAESEPERQLVGQVEALQWLALQIELGFYPITAAAEVGDQLRAAQDNLAGIGAPLALPVFYDANALPPGFRIQALTP